MTKELEVAFMPFHTLPLHFLCVAKYTHTHTHPRTHLIRLYSMHTKLHAQLSPEIAQQFSYLDNFHICLMLSGWIELLADRQSSVAWAESAPSTAWLGCFLLVFSPALEFTIAKRRIKCANMQTVKAAIKSRYMVFTSFIHGDQHKILEKNAPAA